jgi:alpha-tubulin suppressor-like RCC1 family protein
MATRITANNIVDNAITSNKIAAGAVTSAAIANGAITFAQTAAGAFSLIPTITAIRITDASYNVLDDTAANTSGGFIEIAGSNFSASSLVTIGSNNATSTTFVNTSILRAQVAGAAPASYPVYVTDTVTGATAIRINGLTYSSFPIWGTSASLSNQAANTSFAVSLSANSDSNITYSNTTALPAGTTLAANGYFSGTVSIGAQTTYSFDVKATDVENQDASRTFSLTVTVFPQYQLFSWGFNSTGLLGFNDTISRSSPVQIGTNTNWSVISSVGSGVSSAIKTDGTLWTWGLNNNGQLGHNDVASKSSPVQVGTSTNWSKLSLGGSGNGQNMFAIKTDGTLWGWGNPGGSGALGLNSVTLRSSPTQIGTDTNWSLVTTGGYLTFAIKTNGTLWGWGQNGSGQLGQNDRVYRSSPIQIGAGTNWSNVTAHTQTPIARKTDGTLWAWGVNAHGQLGLNDRVYRSSPTQIGAGTTWLSLDSGAAYWVASTKTDGTLWLWGRGQYGQNGQSNTLNRSSPTQLGASTDWSSITAAHSSMYAIKTNGTLWAWGNNGLGQLGFNDRIYRSSPVQVGSRTSWITTSSGGSSVMAFSTP